MYADNTNLTFIACSIPELQHDMNVDLRYLQNWLIANRLTLNMLIKDLIRFMHSLSRKRQNRESKRKALIALTPLLLELTPTVLAVAVSSQDFTSGADLVFDLCSGIHFVDCRIQNQGSFPVFSPLSCMFSFIYAGIPLRMTHAKFAAFAIFINKLSSFSNFSGVSNSKMTPLSRTKILQKQIQYVRWLTPFLVYWLWSTWNRLSKRSHRTCLCLKGVMKALSINLKATFRNDRWFSNSVP